MLRPKYLLFAFIGLMATYVLGHAPARVQAPARAPESLPLGEKAAG